MTFLKQMLENWTKTKEIIVNLSKTLKLCEDKGEKIGKLYGGKIENKCNKQTIQNASDIYF